MKPSIPLDQLVVSFSKPERTMPVSRAAGIPQYGPAVPEPQETLQIRNPRVGEATAVASGAFYSKYTDSSGDTYLQGGQVMSGSGNFTIADLLVIDHALGPVGAAGDKLVLEVTVNGYVVDGVLLAGLTAINAAYVSPITNTIDPNTLPTLANYSSRKVFIEIGRFTATDFLPAYPGNIRIAFCPGAYQITRF